MSKSKRLFVVSVVSVLLLSAVLVVLAGGSYSFSAVGRSVILDGYVTGVGNLTGGTIVADATLTGWLECTNKGGNLAQGQNRFQTSVTGFGPAQVGENGRVYFHIEIGDDEFGYDDITWRNAGCPNRNWTVSDFIHDEMLLTFNALDSSGQPSKPSASASYFCEAPNPATHVEYVCTQVS